MGWLSRKQFGERKYDPRDRQDLGPSDPHQQAVEATQKSLIGLMKREGHDALHVAQANRDAVRERMSAQVPARHPTTQARRFPMQRMNSDVF